jgi:hypothetical protein
MKIVVYLDQDCNSNDLLDSVGNNITAGWYLYTWPLGGEPTDGPFENEAEAVNHGEDRS